MFNVYIIRNNLNSLVYVGQTSKSIEERFRGHLQECRKGNSRDLYKAMRIIGLSNFYVELLCTVTTQEEADDMECYYISLYDSDGVGGYNMDKGGHEGVFTKDSKRYNKHLETVQSQSHRKMMSNIMKDYKKAHPVTEEHRRHLSEANKGKLCGPHHSFTEEQRQLARKVHQRKVTAYDVNGVILGEFDSIKEATKWFYEEYGYDNEVPYSYKRLHWEIKRSNDNSTYVGGVLWKYKK